MTAGAGPFSLENPRQGKAATRKTGVNRVPSPAFFLGDVFFLRR